MDDEVNLTSLIKSTSNYIVKVNKTEFHINICRPLISVPSLTCAHGSAVCKASLNSDNQYVDEIVSKNDNGYFLNHARSNIWITT